MAAWLLGVCVLVLVAGLALIRVGWRGRRINRDPVCRDCGFNLRAFRLPEMHGLGIQPVAASAAGERSGVDATHSLTLGARQGDAAIVEASSAVAGEMTVTVTCPECGGGLKRAKAVRVGERKRMPMVAALGFAVFGVTLVTIATIGYALVNGTNLSNRLPLGLLVLQSRFASADQSKGIAIELEKRVLANALDASQLQLVIERTLEVQADWETPWVEEWGSVYEAAKVANAVTSDQRRRWILNGVKLSLVARSGVRPGDPLPVRPSVIEQRVARNTQEFAIVRGRAANLGEQSAVVDRRQNASPHYHVNGVSVQLTGSARSPTRFSSFTDSIGDFYVPPGTSPGRHTLDVDVSVEVGGDELTSSRPTRRISCEVDVANLQVTPVETIPETAEVAAKLQEALASDPFVWKASVDWGVADGRAIAGPRPIDWYASLVPVDPSKRKPLPVPVFMEVVALSSRGEETAIGFVSSDVSSADESSVKPSIPYFRLFSMLKAPIETPFTVVFRPSVQGAMTTYSLTKIYGGEIRIPIEKAIYKDTANRVTCDSYAAFLEAVGRKPTTSDGAR